MPLSDWLIFYLDLTWRTLFGMASLALNWLGVPWLVVIVVAVFCWLGYKCIKKVRDG